MTDVQKGTAADCNFWDDKVAGRGGARKRQERLRDKSAA
jgi:hypothetical protein